MAYKKAKGSKGISGAKKAPSATVNKSKAPSVEFCGVGDGRPKSSERKQSAMEDGQQGSDSQVPRIHEGGVACLDGQGLRHLGYFKEGRGVSNHLLQLV